MEFVTSKLAKELEEKGFCWDLIATYNKKTEVRCNHINPTISQVMKWLREEKRIVFAIAPMQEIDCDYLGWCITIYKIDDTGYGLSWQEELYHQSYEKVALAGITYVLDNLI